MKKFINYLRNNYESVSCSWKNLTNGKMPKAAIIVWYCLTLPTGLILYPFAKIIEKIVIRHYVKKWNFINEEDEA